MNNSAIGKLDTSSFNVPTQASQFGSILSTVISIIIAIAGIWFLFQILIAGLSWISGAGDQKKVQEAQKKITDSIIGLVILAAAFIITGLLSQVLFGSFNFLLSPEIQTINNQGIPGPGSSGFDPNRPTN